jgi:dihydroxyacetone kinase-like protein
VEAVGVTVSYAQVLAWIEAFSSTVAENREYLTRLDSAIGDADHGINMDRGMKAVSAKLDGLEGEDIGALLKTVGMTLVSTVGGAGGPLYGTLFLQMGMATAGKSELEPEDWAAAFDAAVKGVQMRGKAEPGDKTMADALIPAARRQEGTRELSRRAKRRASGSRRDVVPTAGQDRRRDVGRGVTIR